MNALLYLLPLLAFALIYSLVRARTKDAHGRRAPVQWPWLLAILGCAAAALVLGALTDL